MGLSGSPSKRDAYDRGGGGGGGGEEGEINPLAGAGAHNSHAYRAYNTVFLRTSLFLDTFWGTFSPKIELHHVYERFRKGKVNVILITYRRKNEIFCLLKKVCRFS